MQTLGQPLFLFSNNVFLARVIPLVRMSAKLDHNLGSRGPKTSRKGPFMGAESICKTFEIFNSTTTYAILMKLTTITYLQERSGG